MAGTGIFGNGGVGLGLGTIEGIGDANGDVDSEAALVPNRPDCPPKSVCGAFGVGWRGPISAGTPQVLGVVVPKVNGGKLVGNANTGEGLVVVAGALVVAATFSGGVNTGSAGAGVVAGAELAVAGFSPEGGENEKTGGVFGRIEPASMHFGGGGGIHWPKGALGAAGCATIAGGADLGTTGGLSTSPSRTRGVLASGELRMGRLLFVRGARPKGEADGAAFSVGTGICAGAGGVSLTGVPGGVVLTSLTGDTRGILAGDGV